MLGHKAVAPESVYMADRMVRAALGRPAGSAGNLAGAARQRPHRKNENLTRRRHNSLPEHEQDTHGFFVLSGHCWYLLPAMCIGAARSGGPKYSFRHIGHPCRPVWCHRVTIS